MCRPIMKALRFPLLAALSSLVGAKDAPPCTDIDSFWPVWFTSSELSYSNLGGQGGRYCNPCGKDVPHVVHISNVGRLDDGTVIDLRIENRSEYHAWNAGLGRGQLGPLQHPD